MTIVDGHIHIGDIYTGMPVKYPLSSIPLGLVSILELFKFRRPYPSAPTDSEPDRVGRQGRLLGDIAYMESCRRVQFCRPKSYQSVFKKNNVNRAVVLPIEPMVRTADVVALSRQYPEFIPFASCDFNRPDYCAQLRQHLADGCRGLKIHPVMQRIHPGDQRICSLLEEFAPYDLPVCFHVGPARNSFVKNDAEDYARPEHILPLVQKFPKLAFVFAHLGLGYHDQVIEMAAGHRNIYLDTSFQPATVIVRALTRLGPDRLCFGSDFPLVRQEVTLGILRQVIKDRAALARVLGENMLDLMHCRP